MLTVRKLYSEHSDLNQLKSCRETKQPLTEFLLVTLMVCLLLARRYGLANWKALANFSDRLTLFMVRIDSTTI